MAIFYNLKYLSLSSSSVCQHSLTLFIAAAALFYPLYVDASSTKTLIKKEIKLGIEDIEKGAGDDAKQAINMVKGLVIPSKSVKKELRSKLDDNSYKGEKETIGIYYALMRARDKLGESELSNSIRQQKQLPVFLREVLAPIPNRYEVTLLNRALRDASKRVNSDIMAYAVRQKGSIYKKVYIKNRSKVKDLPTWQMIASNYASPKDMDYIFKRMIKLDSKKGKDSAAQISLELFYAVDYRSAMLPWVKKFANNGSIPHIKAVLEHDSDDGLDIIMSQIPKVKDLKRKQLMNMMLDIVNVPNRQQIDLFNRYVGSKDQEVQLLANKFVAKAKDPSVQSNILKMTDSLKPDERLYAYKILGYTKHRKAREILLAGLFEVNKSIRLASAIGLKEVPSPESLPMLRKSLQMETDKEVIYAVVDAVGAIGNAESVKILRFIAKPNDVDLLKRIVSALHKHPHKSGATVLKNILKNRSREVSWAAFKSLLERKVPLSDKDFDFAFRRVQKDFVSDLNRLSTAAKDVVYGYLLSTSQSKRSAIQTAAIDYAIKRRIYNDKLRDLCISDATNAADRRKILTYLAQDLNVRNIATLERVVRDSKNTGIVTLAAWMLTIEPDKNMEATFRSMMINKDKTLKAIGLYGLATIYL